MSRKSKQNELCSRRNKRLDELVAEFNRSVPTMDVVDLLSNILPQSVIEEIKCEEKAKGRTAANRLLCHKIRYRKNWYVRLVDALKKVDLDELAQDLSRDEKGSLMEEVEHTGPIHRYDKQLQDLSMEIPEEWRNVGRYLGLKEEHLCYIYTDWHKMGHREIVYQMLLTWAKIYGSQATYGALGEALEAAGRRDLREKLYKQEVFPSLERMTVNVRVENGTSVLDSTLTDSFGGSLTVRVEHTGPIHGCDIQVALQDGVEDSAATVAQLYSVTTTVHRC